MVVGAPASVVVVVVDAASWAATDGTWVSTGRKRSSAVLPTSAMALSRSFTPGRSTTMSLPCRVISGSRVPKVSTRLRMMSMATSKVSVRYFPTGDRTTEVPPCRSRPSTGSWSPTSVARNVPITRTSVTTRKVTFLRTDQSSLAPLSAGWSSISAGALTELATCGRSRCGRSMTTTPLAISSSMRSSSISTDRAEDPADGHDLVADRERLEQRTVGGCTASLRQDDQQEERRRDDDEVEDDDHGVVGFLTLASGGRGGTDRSRMLAGNRRQAGSAAAAQSSVAKRLGGRWGAGRWRCA